MSDLALVYNETAEAFDLVLAQDRIKSVASGGGPVLTAFSTGFVRDDGFESAVVLSLFCDRQALENDAIPDGTAIRRGWWADAYARVEGDKIGSRLWLIDREKTQASVLLRARQYALEALQWMIDDGIARAVDVQCRIVRRFILGIEITIVRRDGATFRKLWEKQLEAA